VDPGIARLALLTGPVGIGKTTVAARVVELARRRGFACRGVLAPAQRDAAGLKIGIVGIDLATGERRTLARTGCEMQGPRLGPYSFDAAALEWATAVLLGALAQPPPADGREHSALVVVDEIGKLELWQGQGLAAVLPALASGPAAHVLVIVRESLLEELCARLGDERPHVFWADEQNRDALPGRIAEDLL
jgi:nucleoside-triphosphatase THEP1